MLAIAHNGNLSNGLMFPVVEAFGKKVDSECAQIRAKWERLSEMTQTKGTGEAHPFLSPNDELADSEIWDKGNLDGSVAKKKEMLELEYARAVFKKVMDWEVGASGYAAVWATDNTREALWDAMHRWETYSTTGPRMMVRFFGGWSFDAKDA